MNGASHSVETRREHHNTVVVGAGQAGLALGYHLNRLGVDFVILEAGTRIGGSWRSRWDSLRLFTPAFLDGLPGLPFPGPPGRCPDKDEMADYLESYATRFELPLRLGVRVERLTRTGGLFQLEAGNARLSANNVVVATGPCQRPAIPHFASELDPSLPQLHSSRYRNRRQLPEGTVLVVGAGNSGAEIAMDLARAGRPVILSGRDTGRIPGGSWACRSGGTRRGRSVLSRLAWPPLWWLVTRGLTADTHLGRKIMSLRRGRTSSPLVRITQEDLEAAGVERVPRTDGSQGGHPRLEDGRVLDVTAVVWSTGFAADFDWISVPIFDPDGYPVHRRGEATGAPGLYFLGLPFQHTLFSEMVAGEVFDADHIAKLVAG